MKRSKKEKGHPKNKQNKNKRRKALNKTLIAAAVFAAAGVVICMVSAYRGNTAMMLAGLGMIPGTGIIITPYIVNDALKDIGDWKSKSDKKQLLRESFIHQVKDPTPYHNKVLFGVIREGILNLGVLIIMIAFALIVQLTDLEYATGSDLLKPILIAFLIMIFLIPMLAYNITNLVYRIRTVLRREYYAYSAVVHIVDFRDMWITGKYGTYEFNYCVCLGIRAKNVNDTKAILVFLPDEVYLIPDEEQP